MSDEARGFPGMFSTAWSRRDLLFSLVRREIAGRYRGSWLGGLWSLLTPVLMLLVYAFVFGVVLKVRWGTNQEVDGELAAILFSGVIVAGVMGEILNRSPMLVVQNPNYVKKVVFPLELLAWVTTLAAGFHFFLALLVLLLFLAVIGVGFSATVVALPLVVLPFLLMCLGISWFLSALGVYVRDTAHVSGFVATVLMFLCPIFYPMSAVPAWARDWLWLNPMTYVVQEMRDLLIFSAWPNGEGLLAYWVSALLVSWGGYAWFQSTRSGFADVL